jgi:hypothetical protein
MLKKYTDKVYDILAVKKENTNALRKNTELFSFVHIEYVSV